MDRGDEQSLRLVSNFVKEVKEYENIIFGLTLYQETSPKWVQEKQKESYTNMKRRGNQAIYRAKHILKEAKKGKVVQDNIESFQWPIILEDMKYRIDILLECYERLFPGRSRERALSREEIILLRNEVINSI